MLHAADSSNPSVLKHLNRWPPVPDILVWAKYLKAMETVLSRRYLWRISLSHNEAFARRAKLSTRCKFCLGENHTFDTCLELPLVQLPVLLVSPATTPNLPELVPSRLPLPQQLIAHNGEVCKRCNEDRCQYRHCQHTHVCSISVGQHPAPLCLHLCWDHPHGGVEGQMLPNWHLLC